MIIGLVTVAALAPMFGLWNLLFGYVFIAALIWAWRRRHGYTHNDRERLQRLRDEAFNPVMNVDQSPRRTPAPKPALQGQHLANEAMRRAGHGATVNGVRLTDIGMLSYINGAAPQVNRENKISAQATHLQPFIELNIPVSRVTRGLFRFELLDSTDTLRFSHTHTYPLQQGANFIKTRNWLPLDAHERGGTWHLRISVGERLLAVHEFAIKGTPISANSPESARQAPAIFGTDGELDPRVRRRLAKADDERTSLDDLLEDQEDLTLDTLHDPLRR